MPQGIARMKSRLKSRRLPFRLPLPFQAQRGFSLCFGVDWGTKTQSEIPRCARNDVVAGIDTGP